MQTTDMTPGEIEQLSLLKNSTALHTQGYSFGVAFELVLLKYIYLQFQIIEVT